MERLTERHAGVAVFKDRYNLKESAEKLARYEELEELGLLLKLPCPIGTKVYELSYYFDCDREYSCDIPDINEGDVCSGCPYEHQKYFIREGNFNLNKLNSIDHKFYGYLTREEAEEKLDEMENNDEQ